MGSNSGVHHYIRYPALNQQLPREKDKVIRSVTTMASGTGFRSMDSKMEFQETNLMRPTVAVVMAAALATLAGCVNVDTALYRSGEPSGAVVTASSASAARPMEADGIRITILQVAFAKKIFRWIRVVYEVTNITDEEIVFNPAQLDVEDPTTGGTWIHPRKGDLNAKHPPIRGQSKIMVNLLFRNLRLTDAPKTLRVYWKDQMREFSIAGSMALSDADEVFKNRGVLGVY